jgi:hypothetical protein
MQRLPTQPCLVISKAAGAKKKHWRRLERKDSAWTLYGTMISFAARGETNDFCHKNIS